MAVFAYAGVQAGKKVSGEINALDSKAAQIELRKKKIIVTGIKKSNKKAEPSIDDIPILRKFL